ncbi:MAG: bifunctional 5,10-methylenetetrahydrofolate dehydrogenase/5,10-methenyltetrahydrofolate cyclohydrolase [Deltaproteobacteria bacterium]
MGQLIDGDALAAQVRAGLSARIERGRQEGRRVPGLVTVLVGADPASKVYVGRKQKESIALGMKAESVELAAAVGLDELLAVIETYNARADIDGILVQLPLPGGLDAGRVVATIDPAKDVDGLHPANQAALMSGGPGIRPCTPLGCMRLIDSTGLTIEGKRAVLIGRSLLVGKPMAALLLERHATVTTCHSRTADLAAEVASADVVVAAIGRPGLVRGEWIKDGAVVIDVGMNRVDGKLVGDVETEAAAERAAWITPVPGGVGPMTVAMLLANTYQAAALRDGGTA